MGNCALKPKVLSETGAPAPEEIKDSLLEDEKIVAAKTLSNLFLQDKAKKETKEDEKITPPENVPVTEDLKTALVEEKYPTIEVKAPATEIKTPVTETKAPVGDQEVKNEEAVLEKKVIDEVTVKETETEEEVGREAV